MLTPLAGLFMFISSFAPLFLMFAIRTDHIGVRWALLSISVCGVAVTALVIGLLGRTEPVQVEVRDVAARDSEAVTYLVTYLLPFLLVADPTHKDIATLGLFLGVLAVLYVRSNMVYINPMLALAGYHLFAVRSSTAQAEDLVWVLTRRSEIGRGFIRAVRLVGNVWLRREDRGEG